MSAPMATEATNGAEMLPAVENLSLNASTKVVGDTDNAANASGISKIQTVNDLQLPLSSADATVVKTPLSRPLETSKPAERAAPTEEQLKKYNTLLETVSKWTEIPEKSTAGATATPMQDHERMFLTRDCLFRYLRAI